MNKEELMFIVFVLNGKFKHHDGKVFRDYQDAREFLSDCLTEYPEWKLQGVIGSFILDPSREMYIEFIESFGFPNDKKQVNQLQLFKPSL